MRGVGRSCVCRFGGWVIALLLTLTTTSEAMTAQSELDRPITLAATELPLRNLLDRLGAEAGVRFAYADRAIAELRASIASEGEALRDALDRLLSSLGLRWRWVAGQVVVQAPTGVQGARRLAGRVVDARSGRPIAAAEVVAGPASTLSGPDGRFSLLLLEGVDRVGAEALGYVAGSAAADPAGEFLLPLDPVVIGLSELRIEAKASVVSRLRGGPARVLPELVEQVPATGGEDLLRALETIPGVSLGADANAGLFVRGAPPDQHLVRFDAITVYHSGHLFGFFSPLNPDAVQRVDLYRSAFSTRFAERAGSVFDLRSEDGTGRVAPTNRTRIRVGPLASSLSVQRRLSPTLELRGSVRGGTTRLWPAALRESLLDVSAPEADRDALGERGFRFVDANLSARWRPTRDDVVHLAGFLARDRFQQRLTGEEDGADATDELGTVRESNSFSLGWQRHWSEEVESRTTLSTTTYLDRVANGFDVERDEAPLGSLYVEQENRVRESALRGEVLWEAGAGHRLRLGGDLTRLDLRLDELREESDGPGDANVLLDGSDDLLGSLFLEDRWRPVPAVELRGGVRWTRSGELGESFWSPAASADWMPGGGWRVGVSGGRYHQWLGQVTDETLFGVPVSVWLLTERETRSDHAVLDVEWSGRRVGVRVAGYLRRSEGIGDFTDARGTTSPLFDFDGRAEVHGVESSLRWDGGPWSARVNYTAARVRHRFDAIDDGAAFPATHDRPHTFELVGDAEWGGWRLGAFFVARSGRPFTPIVGVIDDPQEEDDPELIEGARNSARLPGYARLDLSLGYEAEVGGRRWTVTTSLYNVLDRRNPWYRRYEADDGRILFDDVPQLGFLPSITLRVDLP